MDDSTRSPSPRPSPPLWSATALWTRAAPVPDAIRADALPAVEAAGLVRDGLLVRCGRHYRAAAVPECPEVRARTLSFDLPRRLGVRGRTAAWVWWGEPAPAWPPEVFLAAGRAGALHLDWRGAGVGRLHGVQEGDVRRLGDILVTSPARTLRDLRAGAARPLGAASSGAAPSDSASAAPPAVSAVADAVHVVDGVDAPHGVEQPVEVHRIAHLEHEPGDGQTVL
jgi:hypothetical protein